MQSGILVSDEILSEINEGRLVIRANPDRVQGCSYDMTVGTIFSNGKIFDNGTKSQLTVEPGGIISIFTDEELVLPNDICATAFAMNQQSSRGFLVLNPGHVDPGFKGPLTIKALNLRSTPIVIQQGEPVFTIIFERLSNSTRPFVSNKSRADRERDFNSKTVETTPASISEIVLLNPSGPYPTRHETNELIRHHWLSRLSMYGGIVAIILALWAAVTSSISVYLQLRDSKTSSVGQSVTSAASVGTTVAPNSQSNSSAPAEKNRLNSTNQSAARQNQPAQKETP